MKDGTDLTFKNSYKLCRLVDSLPFEGPDWSCIMVNLPMSEDVQAAELWLRNPIACIRELLGNPQFVRNMAYAPEKLYLDQAKTDRILEEMYTGDWWWGMQVSRFIRPQTCAMTNL
jgi:hypothetical protein